MKVNYEDNRISSFEVDLKNNSDVGYQYGRTYRIEVLEDNTWYVWKAEEADTFSFKADAFPLPAKDSSSGSFEYLYKDTLPTGQYRLVVEVTPETRNLEYAVLEFDII